MHQNQNCYCFFFVYSYFVWTSDQEILRQHVIFSCFSLFWCGVFVNILPPPVLIAEATALKLYVIKYRNFGQKQEAKLLTMLGWGGGVTNIVLLSLNNHLKPQFWTYNIEALCFTCVFTDHMSISALAGLRWRWRQISKATTSHHL